MYEWANEMNCAVTVCDTKGIILVAVCRRAHFLRRGGD